MSLTHKSVCPRKPQTKFLLLAAAIAMSATSLGSNSWAAKIDPTMSYISADEPILQAGFPPMPDRIDVPTRATPWTERPDTIIQVPAGIFMKKEDRLARGANQRALTSPNSDVTRLLGKEPTLDPRLDQGNKAEAPSPVVVNQSKTQDLSMTDDEFDVERNKQKKTPSALSNSMKQVRQQLLNPIRSAGATGTGAISRVIHF